MVKHYKKYKKHGVLTWDEFDSDQNKNKYRVVLLKNDDFKFGTLIINAPCYLKLTEDIIFKPDNGDGSNKYFEPSLSLKNERYNDFAYVLGFFAALSIKSYDIVINLNKKTISQSVEHYILQRFYSNIELADQPFMPKQGPANFGVELKSAKFCKIKNGTLGLSSHHGIHGNDNYNINISNLKINKFATGGVALNGAEKIKMRRVEIDSSLDFVPVLGIFSAAVFLRQFTKMAINSASSNMAKVDLTTKLNNLELAIDHVVNDIVANKVIDPNRNSTKVFINETNLSDGIIYGIIINKPGVAVNAFSHEKPKEFKTKNIKIRKTKINNLYNSVREIVALSNGLAKNENNGYNNSNVQTDTAGAVFQILTVLNKNTELYEGNVVSELQLALARWSDNRLPNFDDALYELRKNGKFGTLSIHPAIVAWGTSGLNYNHNNTIINNQTKFSNVMSLTGIKYLGNGDSMFHVDKGIIGIRIDSAQNVDMTFSMNNISNTGDKGSYLPGPYTNGQNGGNFNQDQMFGYCGADAYGVLISASKNVKCKKSKIYSVSTLHGSAYGVDINGESENVEIVKTHIDNIKTDAESDLKLPNKLPTSIGCYVDSTSYNCYLNVKINNVTATNAPYMSNKISINNNSTSVN